MKAVAIGASAGGLAALARILPRLNDGFSAAVMVVQHIAPQAGDALVDRFNGLCRLPVKEAWDKEPIAPGIIYFAPPDYHLMVEHDFHFSLSSEERVNFSRPSIDVLFETALRSIVRT